MESIMAADYREPVRVAIVDDQHLVREALAALLEETGTAKVVGSYRHAEPGLDEIGDRGAAAAIIGFDAQVNDPIVTVARLARLHPNLPLCALVGPGQPGRVHGAIAAGCGGAVSSSAGLDVVVAALQALAAGQAYVDPKLGGQLLSAEFGARHYRAQPKPRE
jgi:two-component system, NarL family, response regulator DesR